MNKRARCAFTLIEVLVAVMIISVVIAALLKMYSNNSHIFSQLTKQVKINQYASLFISNRGYGLESKNIHLDDLVSDFKLERELAKELKDTKVKILYQKVEQIDMSENNDEDSDSSMVFEIGKTVLNINDASTAFLRLRME